MITAGQWQAGDPDTLVIADAGYDAHRLAFILRNLPVQVVLARMRSDRVLHRAAPPRLPGTMGRPPRHGDEFVFGQPFTWGTPDTETVTGTRLYGTALARSWDRLHPKLTHRSSWAAADGTLPIARQPTDGPGWSSPPTPSCGLPGPWQPTGARPWEKPSTPDRLTPARDRRDFRHIRPTTACPTQAPKPSRPGPGPPPGAGVEDLDGVQAGDAQHGRRVLSVPSVLSVVALGRDRPCGSTCPAGRGVCRRRGVAADRR